MKNEYVPSTLVVTAGKEVRTLVVAIPRVDCSIKLRCEMEVTLLNVPAVFGVNFASTVTTAAPLVLQVTNPSGSGKNMYISRVAGSAAAAAIVLTILKNGTVSGSAVTKVNLNFGSTAVSVMTAQSATTAVTGSPVTVSSMILSAGSIVIDYTGRIIVPPNNSFTVSMTLTGSSASTAGIYWWEY